MNLAVEVAGAVAWALASLRWLRVAQREHYLPGSATRFDRRWRRGRSYSLIGWLTFLSLFFSLLFSLRGLRPAAFVTCAVAAVGPLGLGLRGRTSPLAWTPRLRRAAAALVVLEAAVVGAGHLFGGGWVASVSSGVLAPVMVDVALFFMTPVERRLSNVYVRRATEKLRAVAPRVVAITGSYGKTSTKNHLRDLLAGSFEVVASPASFNNRLGLARAINEQLSSGVEVLVAEMGTYAKGEIAEMCSWMRPEVSVLTAVGPVHLERFGSLGAIAEAKSEIFFTASVAVINADDQGVVFAATRAAAQCRMIRCSAVDSEADVYVDGERTVWLGRERVGRFAEGPFPINVACAVGAASALGLPASAFEAGLARLSPTEHRQQVSRTAEGVWLIDDTYNSNPAGAEAALARLAALEVDGERRRIVVTPGMVELGKRQHDENVALAEKAAKAATHLVVVGTTNRAALQQGWGPDRATVTLVANREAAVDWVQQTVTPGDAVLYENDLPDHYP